MLLEKKPNDLLGNFENYLESLNYQPGTITTLKGCLKEYSQTTSHPKLATQKELKQYHEHLQNRPHKRRAGALSESYIYTHMYSLRLFFDYMQQAGEIENNPANSLKLSSPKYKQREPLTIEEIKQLYTTTKNQKERAMLSIFYGCGLRRSEGEKLNLKDVNFTKGLLYVREGKGGKRRVVPMSEKVQEDLQNYLREERDNTAPTNAFMTNKIGLRMRGQSFATMFKNLKERADLPSEQGGVEKKVSLHNLRHSIATHLLEQGLRVEKVKEFLGHELLETTQVYTHINKSEIC